MADRIDDKEKEGKFITLRIPFLWKAYNLTKEEVVDILANQFTDDMFKDFWQERKEALKTFSKKEAVEEAFFEAIANLLHNILPDYIGDEESSTGSRGSIGND